MEYCPYCAEKLYKPSKVCPHCKKTLDMELLQAMYEPGEQHQVNKKIKKKIWFMEHSHIIFPVITLLIGFVAGALLSYSMGQLKFANERSAYEQKISELNKTIASKDAAAGSANAEFKKQLAEKEAIISLLMEQKDNLSRIIRFTNRLVKNSTIIPNSQADSDYFLRNFRYLERQFNNREEKLKAMGINPDKTYNLNPVPQLTTNEG